MKTTIATAALMVLMTAATVYATPDTTMNSIPKDLAFKATVNQQVDNIIEFRVEKPAGEKVILKIYTENNNKIYQRTLRKEEGLELNCDMSDFGRGTYTAVVERNGVEVVRKSITIK
jgi:hypothetical protein